MLDRELIRKLVERALDEDLPDITAEAIFEAGDRGTAEFVIKSPGVIAGLEFAELTFATLDSSARFTARVEDGAVVQKGDVIGEVSASVIALLSGERTALNFMQRASPSMQFTGPARRSTTRAKPFPGCACSISTPSPPAVERIIASD